MKRGFTLVELAIVLVIIGLLIGGILAASSMLETVKINSGIRQLSQYDVAVNNFRNIYKGFPGDNVRFTPHGDNDGLIDIANGVPGGEMCVGGACQEKYNFWPQLSETKMISETYITMQNGVRRPGIDLPISKLRKDIFIDILSSTTNSSYAGPKGNYYLMTSFNADRRVIGTLAFAMDRKIDDLRGNTGTVRSTDQNDGGECEILDENCALFVSVGGFTAITY